MSCRYRHQSNIWIDSSSSKSNGIKLLNPVVYDVAAKV
jgi:hypothetical protein